MLVAVTGPCDVAHTRPAGPFIECSQYQLDVTSWIIPEGDLMHSLKIMAVVVCILVVVPLAMAAEDLGIRETARVDFSTPIRVSGTLLPAGEYVVQHTMEGQEHVMVFQSVNHKVQDVKAKCQLVQLGNKADQTRTVYQLNAANERVLQELVFAGDTAKHVF
jgi:hypothetical protein